ncbi:MAG TPA: response regulator [Geomonas sp.]|nr:response regulator [Geomonas sp.]
MANPANPRILLVDDIKMFLDIQKNILQALPVDVATATNGHEALRLVEEFSPDLIVLDSNMPGMDGVTCCSELKQHHRHRRIPVIMTVPNCDDNAALCRAAGCEAVLRKPLDAGVFLDAVTCFIPLVERRDRRVEILVPVYIKIQGRQFSGAILNISRSGALIEPDEPVPAGAILQINFTLPLVNKSPIQLYAKVVRLCSPDSHGMHAGAGVAFVSENGEYLRLPETSKLCRYLGLSKTRD